MKTHQPVWTSSRARLQLQGANENGPDWLFLPGGPGFGSASLTELTQDLNVPGQLWHVDMPNDGNNRFPDIKVDLLTLKQALVESVQAFHQPILVAHSFGGMLALSTPALRGHLKGLILLNSAPNAKWMDASRQLATQYHLPDTTAYKEKYKANPSDENFKQFTLESTLAYFFLEKRYTEGRALLERLTYNHQMYDWAGTQFHANYQAAWIPDCPTLILGSEFDYLTPLELFYDVDAFLQANINIVQIPQAGHFPWIENYYEVQKALQLFYKGL